MILTCSYIEKSWFFSVEALDLQDTHRYPFRNPVAFGSILGNANPMIPYVHLLRISKDNLPGGSNVSLYHWARDRRIRSKTHSLEKLGLKKSKACKWWRRQPFDPCNLPRNNHDIMTRGCLLIWLTGKKNFQPPFVGDECNVPFKLGNDFGYKQGRFVTLSPLVDVIIRDQ